MKTITKKQFRALLTLSIVAAAASVGAGALDALLLPQALLDYQKSQPSVRPTLREVVMGILGIPGIIAAIVSLIGLYRFWPCARWLSVATWIYMLALMPFGSGVVLTNLVAGAGAVMAIAYFPPAADWFQKKELRHEPIRQFQ